MKPLLYKLRFQHFQFVCFPDITAKEFIEMRGKQRSRYELLVDFLSEMLSVPSDDVNVFSLMEVKDRMLDVRFAVHVGPNFLQPEKMHGYLAAHKQKVGSVVEHAQWIQVFFSFFLMLASLQCNLLNIQL